MKYQAPYGQSDPNSSYVNGNPSIGLQGSIPPAAAFEEPMRELVAVITNSNIVPSDSDLQQVTKGIQNGALNYAVDAGAANLLSVATVPPLAQYTPGLVLRVKIQNTNTGPVTIDAGPGRVNVRHIAGSALNAGDLPAGGVAEFVYDGTAFQMVNFFGQPGTGGGGGSTTYYVNMPYAVDTSPTANIVTVSFTPAITTLAAGEAILVKVANTNSGPTQININAMAPINIFAQGGGSLLPCDILSGSVFMLVFDGTNFYVTPNPSIIGSFTIPVPSSQFNTPAAVFNALARKQIGPLGGITIQLASGQFAPFGISHPSCERILVTGTMIGSAPTWASFAQSGPSSAQRASDGAINLTMLRSRYGTEIVIPSGGGNGIWVAEGTYPQVSNLLITATKGSTNSNGIGNHQMSLNNVSVWGCYNGFIADPTGNIVANGCFACNCYWGFNSSSGGTFGIGACGAFGCDNTGIVAGSQATFIISSTYSRCNGSYGYLAQSMSMMGLTGCDGVLNGSIDVYATGMSYMRVEVNANYFSPALNTFGNLNSIITTS
jgi:hypothetical protein